MNMTIQQFIEKAIEGGWNDLFNGKKPLEVLPSTDVRNFLIKWNHPDDPQILRTHEFLLDPLAWQAVGKVEGWNFDRISSKFPNRRPFWHIRMLDMIDALAEGKTLEEFIETL